MSEIRKRAIEGLREGDAFVVSRTFTEAETQLFGELSRDYNPVHYDDRFADAKNLPGRICHGLLVGGMVTEIGGQIGWLASGIEFRFLRPVYFGDTVTCRLTITRIDEQGRADAEAVFTNQDGVTAAEASLTGRLPGPGERQVLQAMVSEGDPTNKIGAPTHKEGDPIRAAPGGEP
jgi:acyl dehydratase